MFFEGGQEAKSYNPGERYYILRPEVVEAYFYLWRCVLWFVCLLCLVVSCC